MNIQTFLSSFFIFLIFCSTSKILHLYFIIYQVIHLSSRWNIKFFLSISRSPTHSNSRSSGSCWSYCFDWYNWRNILIEELPMVLHPFDGKFFQRSHWNPSRIFQEISGDGRGSSWAFVGSALQAGLPVHITRCWLSRLGEYGSVFWDGERILYYPDVVALYERYGLEIVFNLRRNRIYNTFCHDFQDFVI